MVTDEDIFILLKHSWSSTFLELELDIKDSFVEMGFTQKNAEKLLENDDAWDEDATPQDVVDEMWDDFLDDLSREFEKDFTPIKLTDTCQTVADHINKLRSK